MLRALASIYIEGQGVSRRDVFKVFRICAHSSAASDEQRTRKLRRYRTTVLSSTGAKTTKTKRSSHATFNKGEGESSQPPQPPRPPPPRPPRAWSALAALTALTASLGGVYWYRKMSEDVEEKNTTITSDEKKAEETVEIAIPAIGEALPAHVQYLLVGGGTASFAAMRAIRSARPDAQVLIVAAETALPYMRPPLSKELWREPDLAARATSPDALTFRQWNGRRRSVTYEPNAFYTPAEKLREGGAGAGVARGWRATRLDPARHSAELAAPGGATHTVTYDKCLIATGVRARRVAGLRAAAAAGRSLALRGVRDVARLAAALDDPAVRSVAVVGGGFLASELAVALADRLREDGKRVIQVFRESAPLAGVLPRYLADDVAVRLTAAGVELLPDAEVTDSSVRDGRVTVRLSSGERLEADLVVECVGSEPEAELARESGLELHPELGGVLVNAELQARSDVFAAGDVACFYDEALGRRRVEHHDHAVVSGRLAGENMAALAPPRHYQHQSMFWSDLGPRLGYEAIGIVDARLPTVGVFSADAVGDEAAETRAVAEVGASEAAPEAAREAAAGGGAPRRYERGVVFYVRERRVVGVLLWNLFNRMHVARQVLSQGEFDDLFEVAKLFSPHEED
ncbi:apoptosis-inducing factor 1, mitochondrial-like isoform X1 [Vanessa atalanta]|uniref:apoptosis-inducing factor 1, mitochondrial-like isoform X1 n=1 Tax=Vanessa atalanta TaxID=42275 RepID=UPI001FCDD432|nr:apoptosis-inducing factor 1, mitochondrial-like isoform X1 [Vanessa atalanta]